jgi:hypothetical protein
MFFSRELNVISGKKSISPKDLNASVDAVGLPYGFRYSKRFLLFGIGWVHKVEKTGEKTYRVPSESKPGKFYNITFDPINCECPAFHRFKVTPYPFCKHIVAAMVKEQDVTDAFFDWQILKGKNGVGEMDKYIQARFTAGTANTSILEPLPELPIKQSFSWEVAYQKCCEVVGTKAIKASPFVKGYPPLEKGAGGFGGTPSPRPLSYVFGFTPPSFVFFDYTFAVKPFDDGRSSRPDVRISNIGSVMPEVRTSNVRRSTSLRPPKVS